VWVKAPVHPTHVQCSPSELDGTWPRGPSNSLPVLRTIPLGHQLRRGQLQLATGQGAETILPGTDLPRFVYVVEMPVHPGRRAVGKHPEPVRLERRQGTLRL